MNSRIRMIVEDYENLLEMHEEHAEGIDLDDMEARALWEQIEGNLRRLSRRVRNLKRGKDVDEFDIDDVEARIEQLNDLYGEVAALAWGDAAAVS